MIYSMCTNTLKVIDMFTAVMSTASMSVTIRSSGNDVFIHMRMHFTHIIQRGGSGCFPLICLFSVMHIYSFSCAFSFLLFSPMLCMQVAVALLPLLYLPLSFLITAAVVNCSLSVTWFALVTHSEFSNSTRTSCVCWCSCCCCRVDVAALLCIAAITFVTNTS